MVALVALAGVGAVAMSTSAATTTLAGDGTDQVTGFTANASNDIETSIASDGTDFSTDGTETLYMNVTYDGEEYALTSDAVSSGTSASQTVNITNDQLAELPGDAGQNTTVTVHTWGENSTGDVTTAETNFNADITFADSYAVAEMDDSSADLTEPDVGVLSSSWASVSSLWSSSSDDPVDTHSFEQTVGVNGSDTTVTVTDKTTNGSDAFDNAIGDKESGDLIYGASAGVNGSPVLAFYQSADSDIVDTDTDTYAVYDANGNGEWTFHLGDDYSDASSVDVYVSSQSMDSVSDFSAEDRTSVLSQAGMGMTSALTTFGFGSFGAFNLFSLASIPIIGGMAVAFVIPAGRRRLGA
ncbi:hypothetical protein DVR14_00525 (plasmid) [Natrinema thermotolerans]|nr:hypothetical protein DVR14_00525 [Natrinema thermotolerans]